MNRLAKHAHSARVRLRLLVNGDDLEVAQVGGDSCILRECDVSPTRIARHIPVRIFATVAGIRPGTIPGDDVQLGWQCIASARRRATG